MPRPKSAKPKVSPPPLKRGPGRPKKRTAEDDAPEPSSPPAKRARNAAPSNGDLKADSGPEPPTPKPPAKKKGAAAQDKMPLAARTAAHALRIGAHVSSAGGVQNVIPNALHIGANALACFLKSQRKWANPPLQDGPADLFAQACSHHSYDAGRHIVPHGSYLVNLAAEEEAKATQAYESFLDDLKRCDRLGIRLYNFHPGNTNGRPREDAIRRLAAQLNKAHKATSSVITLLENMAAAPTANTIGGRFEDLRDVIALIDDKARVGVCLDTCHAFAGGYDLRSPEAYAATMAEFDEVVGREYLMAVHLNDSKGVFKSHRDLHQNIGLGFLGLRAFHNVMNDVRFAGVPMVLETPIDRKDEKGKSIEDHSVWSNEIKLLESLHGMGVESDEFLRLEKQLADKGADERKKLQDQFDKKDKTGKAKGKGKRKKDAETSDEESE